MIQPRRVAHLVLTHEPVDHIVDELAVTVEEIIAAERHVLQRLDRRRVEQVLWQTVAGERRIALSGPKDDALKLIADQQELLIDRAVADDGDAEPRDDVGGCPAGAHAREAAEVAVPHRLRRQQRRRLDVILAPARLDGGEEERAIVAVVAGYDDGAAGGDRHLIGAQVVLRAVRIRERERRRVPFRVAVVPQRGSRQAVRPGLRRRVDDAAAGLPELRGVRGRLRREFLDGFGREAHDGAGQPNAGVVDAVGEDRRAAGPPAVDAEIEPRDRCAGCDRRILAAHVAGDVWNRDGEVEHAAIVERDPDNLALGDRLAGRPRIRVEQRRLRAHGHLRLQRAGLERHVDGRGRCRVDLHQVHHGRLEPARFDDDPVDDGLEVGG